MYHADEMLAQDALKAAKANHIKPDNLPAFMHAYIEGYTQGHQDGYEIGYQECLMMTDPYTEGEVRDEWSYGSE